MIADSITAGLLIGASVWGVWLVRTIWRITTPKEDPVLPDPRDAWFTAEHDRCGTHEIGITHSPLPKTLFLYCGTRTVAAIPMPPSMPNSRVGTLVAEHSRTHAEEVN